MSLGTQSTGLWRRAPIWRTLVIAAVVTTVLAVVMSRSGSAPPVAPVPPVPPVQTPAPPGGLPAPPQASHACGPQNSTVLQAPVVVAPNGQVPSNVKGVGGAATRGGPTPEMQARLVRFIIGVDAAASEQRQGEQCVRMSAALEALEPLDYAYANCFVDGQDKMTRAESCKGRVVASERRFETLGRDHAAMQGDSSAPVLERLAKARAAMTDFDENRERWNASAEMLDDAERARADIERSTARIDALERAAAAGASATPDQLEALARAGELTALDRGRLTAAQKAALEQAVEAKRRLAESDARLAALGEALGSNVSSERDARERLIDAVSRLETFDTVRADAAQAAEIASAKTTAAAFAMEDLVENAARFDTSSSAPESFQRLVDLETLVSEHGGVAEPGPEQSAAMETARTARAALARSDGRIERMREIVALVDRGGPAEYGSSVVDAHEALTPFDVARMGEDDATLFEKLAAARDVTVASQGETLTPEVPLYVGVNDPDDLLLADAVVQLSDRLKQQGFNIVSAEERSAVSLTLSRGEVEHASTPIGTRRVNSAKVELSLAGQWTYADKPVRVPSASGSGVGGSPDALAREAMGKATDKLVGALRELAGLPEE